MVEICRGDQDYDMKTDCIILFMGVFIITIVLLWPILSGIKADIRNMQSPAPTFGPHHWNAVVMKAYNQTKPFCTNESPRENWQSPLQVSYNQPGNSNYTNSTDGGRCVDNICQVADVIQISVFCQPVTSATQEFSWN